MNRSIRLAVAAATVLMAISLSAQADALVDSRYTDTIKRDQRGRILRRADVIAAFKKQHPCPATGKTYGKCPRWHIDHVIPLACLGKDEVSNAQWLPVAIKSGAGFPNKDRWERKVYAKGEGTSICENEVVTLKGSK